MRSSANTSKTVVVMFAACAGVMMTLLWGETPHGGATGTLIAAETGQPLTGIAVWLAPESGAREPYRTSTDAAGRFAFSHLPTGAYTLTAKTHAHEQPQKRIVVRESRTSDAVVELRPTKPFLRVFTHDQVFTTREEPRLHCHGFTPEKDLLVKVYRAAPEVAVKVWRGSTPPGLAGHTASVDSALLDQVPELSVVSARRVALADRDLEGIFREEVSLGKLPPGVYLAVCAVGEVRKLVILAVTDLSLVAKAAPGEALVYAADIHTGAPAPRTAVELVSDQKLVAREETDASGFARFRVPRGREDEDHRLEFVGHAGESIAVALVRSYWPEDDAALRVYTYTDRPVYRPGHRVYFKSIVRELKTDTYHVPTVRDARVRVVDYHDDVVYSGDHTLSAFGTLYGEFALSENALPGSYTLTVLIGGVAHETDFSVEEYRKPEFEVTVKTARERYVRGETIEAAIEARYYYGAPVPGADVEYEVTRSHWWSPPTSAAWDEDLCEPEGQEAGETVTAAHARTDKRGRLTFSVPTASKKDRGEGLGEDWHYTIHATVTDRSRRNESGSGTVLVTQGEYRLELSVDDSVARPGQPISASIRAVDYEGRPVGSARGQAVLSLSSWDADREHLAEKDRRPWQADAQGRAEVTLTPPESGDYRLVARAADSRGNRIARAASLWVMSGDHESFRYPYQDLDVRADKDVYREGDTAQIIVNTKHAPTSALLTVESHGVLQERLVRLEARSTILQVRVDPAFLPAVTAKVCFVQGKQFFQGEAPINVSRERKALKVAVASENAEYRPGAWARYHVRTTSPDGKPVRAEVSFGLVDAAVYAVASDRTPDIVQYFYPKRELLVDTAFSFPEIYLDAEGKAATTIPTRRQFMDTAFWRPAVVTNGKGEAVLELPMPDNLTTWRATCRAATTDTRVGQATCDTVVNKQLLVRLEAPRFFTQGDEVRLAAIAHNLSDAEAPSTVGLEAPGLTIPGRATQTCRIPPGETVRVEWPVEVATLGSIWVRVWVSAPQVKLSDAMELRIPVLPRGRRFVDVRSGSAQSTADLQFTVRDDCIPGTQRLTVRLTPSLASAMLGALEYLAAYPYGCTEQTMSAFLPDVMIAQALGKLGVSNPDLQARLPKMVQAGLLKLYQYQHDDGGWGWWAYDRSDPWMTAYVVFGLLQAREAGFPINEGVLRQGVAALAMPKAPPPQGLGLEADQYAYLAYVLTLAEKPEEAGKVVDRFTHWEGLGLRATLTNRGRAWLALAMARAGRTQEARSVLEEIWRRFPSVPPGATTWGEQPSEVEEAAALLLAASELTPEDSRLPDLVRRMLEARRGNRWHSTRDTAFVLYGLVKYLEIAHELQPDMQAVIRVKGHPVAVKRFTARDVFQPEFELALDQKALAKGPLAVTLEKTGQGNLYYTATLEQVAAVDLRQPVRGSAGMTVERTYRKLDLNPRHRGSSDQPARRRSVTTFDSGDVVEVTLTLRSDRPQTYLLVEDPLPAGCEASDRGRIDTWEWHDWWADRIVRDEKVCFAIRNLDPGAHRLTYRMSAQVPGRYTALPPEAYDMYNPAIRADGVADSATVRP